MKNGGDSRTSPVALAGLHDSIWREKILRARAIPPHERIAAVMELSDFQFALMHAGAMKRGGTGDTDAAWREVAAGLDRLARARDRGFYTTAPPDEA